MREENSINFWLLICVFMVGPFQSEAQIETYNYVNYSTSNDLPSNEVHCSYQNSNGTMLFGTDNGLIKFDGNRFEKIRYRLESDRAYMVTGIKKDYSGKVWIKTYRQGILLYSDDSLIDYKFNNHIINTFSELFISDFQFDESVVHISPQKKDEFILKLQEHYIAEMK